MQHHTVESPETPPATAPASGVEPWRKTVADLQAVNAKQALLMAAARLATARRAAVATAAEVKRLKEAWHVANAPAIEAAMRADAEQLTADKELRLLTREYYDETGEKKPAPGLEVKTGADFAFDPELCLAFARATSIGYVPETYDEKALTAVAKTKLKDDGSTQVPGITWTEKVTVNVASDLDKALATAAVTAPAPEAGQ